MEVLSLWKTFFGDCGFLKSFVKLLIFRLKSVIMVLRNVLHGNGNRNARLIVKDF